MKNIKTFLLTGALVMVASLSQAQDLDLFKIKVASDSKSISENSAIISAIKAQNAKHAGLDEAAIIALDKAWRTEVKTDAHVKVAEVLNNAASAELVAIKDGNDGEYGEIFVMDNKGLNVAMSDITSDYWQGDEAKWKETFLKGSGATHVSEVKFDESVQAFTAQLSSTITDPETGEAIGAVTFGVIME
tara:strand:+ start:21987 stop:22553 length:567 start_codon:yes stop_codon:yes gene_type:complete